MSEWDPGVFWERYYEFWNKLADLKFVDACLDWRDDGAFSGNKPSSVTLEVGRYHSFEIHKTIPNQGPAGRYAVDYDAMLQSFTAEADGWASGVFSGADDSVAFVTRPDTTVLGGPVADLRNQAAMLESRGNDGDIGNLRVYLNDWEGDSYDSFMVFHQRLTDAAKFQAQYVNAVANYLDTTGGVIHSGQLALIDGIVALADAVEAQLLKRAADNRGESDVVKFLSMAAAATGAAALVPGPEQVVFGAASLVFGTLAGAIPEEASEQIDVEVVSADDLAEQFAKLFGNVASSCNAYLEETRVGTAVIKDLVDSNWDVMIPPRPDITEKIDPSEFHHDSSPYYDG